MAHFLKKNWYIWAVVVPQLVEQSLPIPEVRGSNAIIGEVISFSLFVIFSKYNLKCSTYGVKFKDNYECNFPQCLF